MDFTAKTATCGKIKKWAERDYQALQRDTEGSYCYNNNVTKKDENPSILITVMVCLNYRHDKECSWDCYTDNVRGMKLLNFKLKTDTAYVSYRCI